MLAEILAREAARRAQEQQQITGLTREIGGDPGVGLSGGHCAIRSTSSNIEAACAAASPSSGRSRRWGASGASYGSSMPVKWRVSPGPPLADIPLRARGPPPPRGGAVENSREGR